MIAPAPTIAIRRRQIDIRFHAGDRCQNHNGTRFGTVTRDCLEYSTAHVLWDDGEERQENPECVDPVPVPASAEKRVVQPVLAGKNAWDEYKKAGAHR